MARMGREARMQKLLTELISYHAAHARTHLPWRRTRDPYKILVSEVMLQQTQAGRVVPYYRAFLKRFPTVQSLARARLSEVLQLWQGLGYNRRAKHLHLAAKAIARGGFPRSAAQLEELPGVGRYTGKAVAAFAFNAPEVFIETNIRTVFLHHFYASALQKAGTRKIPDAELLALVGEALERSRMEPREFYAALMDYGSHLKKRGVRLNARSAQYVKQSKFKGSLRELRGALLRELLARAQTTASLTKNLSRKKGEVEDALKRLEAEGLVVRRKGRWSAG